ncbi:MAG: hypothetical protein JSR72_06975 [Proteobacteria bacterium]|nr:hypothetical protein [Pseudomonadota bacterium]
MDDGGRCLNLAEVLNSLISGHRVGFSAGVRFVASWYWHVTQDRLSAIDRRVRGRTVTIQSGWRRTAAVRPLHRQSGGSFAAEGLDVQFPSGKNSNDEIVKIATGIVDFGRVGLDALLALAGSEER